MKDKKETIRYSNSLIKAAYSLGRNEKRILYLAIKKVLDNPSLKIENERYVEVLVTRHEYQKIFNCKNAKRDIEQSVKDFDGKKVVFYLPSEDFHGEKAIDAIAWIGKTSVRPKVGTTFFFNAEIIEIITRVKKDFTHLLIGDAGKLKTANSMRLYESLYMHDFRKSQHDHSVEWMIERFCLPESYRRMSDFRRRFLKPSVNEINEKTGMNLSYSEETRSGKVWVNFKWIREKMNDDLENGIIRNDHASSRYEHALSTLLDIMTDAKDSFTQKEMENLSMHFFLMVSNKDAHPSDMDKILSVKREG